MIFKSAEAKTKFIFITGGVVSSLGKGITGSAIAALLQAYKFTVRMRKLDPYLNMDPGTMSPTQHGEVFVTDDGAETDLDLGHYERFTDLNATKDDSVTSGKLYYELLQKERRGDYLGQTVQTIPHYTNLIKSFIFHDQDKYDFIIYEIGGTVGDIEGQPFLEAARQIGYELGKEFCLFIHLTLLPYISSAQEVKTKPTQHSVKSLNAIGIQPDILICRCEHAISETNIAKIALFCNVKQENVISAIDVKNIYQLPIFFHKEGLDQQILKHFKLNLSLEKGALQKWEELDNVIDQASKNVKITIVGKYTQLHDAYKSLVEAFGHAGTANLCKVQLTWIDAKSLDSSHLEKDLQQADGILIPGGFGGEGLKNKITAIKYARENNKPFLGICLGMQLAILEFAKDVAGIKDANSTEVDPATPSPVIALITQWYKGEIKEIRNPNNILGGTMRLGAYSCYLKDGTLAKAIYNTEVISERHRHRYEFNKSYQKQLEDCGMVFSGSSADGNLIEMIELKDHPWFVGVQFHPELKSRPFNPHPLFVSFVKAALLSAKDS